MSFELTEKEEKEIQAKIDKLFPECKDIPEWVSWYYKTWIKPKVEELDSEWYKRNKRRKDKLVDIAHETLMSEHLDEILESMPTKLREDMEKWEQQLSTEDIPQPSVGIYKTCHNPACKEQFRARRRTQKYCSQTCYRNHVSQIYAKT